MYTYCEWGSTTVTNAISKPCSEVFSTSDRRCNCVSKLPPAMHPVQKGTATFHESQFG